MIDSVQITILYLWQSLVLDLDYYREWSNQQGNRQSKVQSIYECNAMFNDNALLADTKVKY